MILSRNVNRVVVGVAMVATLGLAVSCKSPNGSGVSEDESASTDTGDAGRRAAEMSAAVAGVRALPNFPVVTDAAKEVYARQAFEIVNHATQAEIEAMVAIMVENAKPSVPQLRGLTPEGQETVVKQISDSIAAEAMHHDTFASWKQVEENMNAELQPTVRRDATGTNEFLRDVERLGKTKFVAYNLGPVTEKCRPVDSQGRPRIVPLATCVLRNGEAGFAARDRLIASAQKSIWISAWAFYDDFTGRKYVQDLIAKKQQNPNIDIRVAVDGATATRPAYKGAVDQLSAAGIQVIRWRRTDSLEMRGYGFHRKLFVVDPGLDTGAVIIGGMNFGDEYSRINPASEAKHKWRDTDIMILGKSAVNQAGNDYIKGWNFYLSKMTVVGATPISAALGTVSAERGVNSVAFIDHEPTDSIIRQGTKTLSYDPIYLTTLRAINGAKTSIDISNAYYIATQPIENALIAAMGRGVKVRIHTNSKESVDDPTLVGPILRGLAKLKKVGGANVAIYLRQVSTLHSKYLVIDGKFGWVGSYNLHPRSYWYETETVLAFNGPDLGGKVQAMFNQDIADTVESKPATDADLTVAAGNELGDTMAFFFSNLL